MQLPDGRLGANRWLNQAGVSIRRSLNHLFEAADHHGELASFASDDLPAFEINQDLADLGARGAYQIRQLSLRNSDPDQDSARVPYSKLECHLEQRYRHAFGQPISKEARITSHQKPQMAICSFRNPRIIRGKDSKRDTNEVLGSQLADSAILKCGPLKVVVDNRRHEGHPEEQAGRHNCHNTGVHAIEMDEFRSASQQDVGVGTEGTSLLEDEALVAYVSRGHRVVEAFELSR